MKLGVIGSGNIGKAIGSWAANVGYQVVFSAKDEAHAKAAADQSGNGAKSSGVRGAVEAGGLILLAVPYDAAAGVLKEVGPLMRGKVLIDATNPLSADFTSLTIGHTTSAAEEIAKRAPEARVVKAFNTVFAQVYASQNPRIGGNTVSVFYAGDDGESKSKVAELISRLGFDAVDCGPLKAARNIEPLAMLNISLGYGVGLGTGIGFSLNR